MFLNFKDEASQRIRDENSFMGRPISRVIYRLCNGLDMRHVRGDYDYGINVMNIALRFHGERPQQQSNRYD